MGVQECSPPDHIGPGWVLGRQVDADGTERVRLYRLER